MNNHFSENLRLLCSYLPSITSLATRLNVNRSQINKYLAGNSFPRPALLRKICDHFGVESHEILMPPEEFSSLIRVRGIVRRSSDRALSQRIDALSSRSDPRLLGMRGSYFEYYASMSMPGKVLRSLMIFEERERSLFYRRIERICAPGASCHKHFVYEGMALMLGDRIFLTDYESGLGVELTQSIMFPDYAMLTSRINGLKIGVSANQQRYPCASRVVIERTPFQSSLRTSLRSCGLYAKDASELPGYIKAAIDNTDSGPDLFLARYSI